MSTTSARPAIARVSRVGEQDARRRRRRRARGTPRRRAPRAWCASTGAGRRRAGATCRATVTAWANGGASKVVGRSGRSAPRRAQDGREAGEVERGVDHRLAELVRGRVVGLTAVGHMRGRGAQGLLGADRRRHGQVARPTVTERPATSRTRPVGVEPHGLARVVDGDPLVLLAEVHGDRAGRRRLVRRGRRRTREAARRLRPRAGPIRCTCRMARAT